MNIYAAIVLLLLSFILIGLVIERYFVPSLENIAGWLKMPDDVAGATLLAFGSSAPELFTALMTVLFIRSRTAFGIGNIVGSALFQILVVIGFAALVKTAYLQWQPVIRDGAAYAFSVMLIYYLMRDGVITVWDSGFLVGTYGVYLGVLLVWPRVVKTRKRDHPEPPASSASPPAGKRRRKPIVFRKLDRLLEPIPNPTEQPGWTIPLFLLSLLVIAGGSYIFLRSGEAIAASVGIDPTIIALTVIAGGSSIPELITSAIVARQGKGDMAIANALGSNTFDICISFGLPVLLATLIYGPVAEVGGANITSTVFLLFATVVMVLGLLALQKFKASRPFGAVLVLAYAGYVLAAYMGWLG